MSVAKFVFQPSLKGDYQMIEKIKIINFRCFRQLELSALKRFSVLVGPSGSGKTAFLEALFLVGAGSAEVYLRTRKWRGLLGNVALTGSKASYESLFRELFFGFDPRAGARIEIVDTAAGFRKLNIGFKRELEFDISLKEPVGDAFAVEPIMFRWKTPGTHAESIVKVKDGQLNFGGTTSVYPIWLISNQVQENYVQYYSELSKRGQADEINRIFCKAFPKVRSLSIESAAGEYSVFAELYPHGEKIPIGMLSSGMNKFFSILCAIASNPNGVVLIDEIESGFYFESLPFLLKNVCDFCELTNVQLIATTHSYELLESFASAMKGREDNFDLLRSTSNDDGSVDIRISRGTAAISTIRQHLEVR
jgi:predicted ATPase